MNEAVAGDLLILGLQKSGDLLIAVIEKDSTVESQFRWLFGVEEDSHGCEVKTEAETRQIELGYAGRIILSHLGLEDEGAAHSGLDEMRAAFGDTFPQTRVFSQFARAKSGAAVSNSDPDSVLLHWMEQEELLFRTFERFLVGQRLEKGFANDVDEFVRFSLSVQNRRKSRAGYALENHLEALFVELGIGYSREKVTENRTKPDFVFPGIEQYHHPDFPSSRLTMLGAKQSCKDRWRQVLSEASRIRVKHLITLEPSISLNQTDEMKAHQLQLVVPLPIHSTFTSDQQNWLMSVSDFVALVSARETA